MHLFVERLLAMTEKPANIVRRRLEQAGYDDADDLRLLAVEDIQYLMKFVYKSNVLGPAVSCSLISPFTTDSQISRRTKISYSTSSSRSTSLQERCKQFPSCFTRMPIRSSSSISLEIRCSRSHEISSMRVRPCGICGCRTCQ